MTTITTEMIKELREKTNAGILDCERRCRMLMVI